MKTIRQITCVVFILLFTLSAAHADDAVYEGDGIDVYPLENGDIQLVSEVITISPGWNVHVDMAFKNHGAETTVQMGFPVFSSYSPDYGEKEDDHSFQTWVNGEKVVVAKKHGVPNPIKNLRGFPDTVFVYPVNFKSGETKNIVHSYTVGGYSDSIGGWAFKYILRTGALWKGLIENLKIIYKTDASWARSLPCITPTEYESELNGEELVLKWEFKNYKPDTDLSISGSSRPQTSEATNFMTSHKRGMATIDSCSIRNLKNSIFASFGYPFKKPFVRAQFYYPGSRYKENPGFDINKLPSDNKLQINYLSKIERWRTTIEEKRKQGLLDYEKEVKNLQSRFEADSPGVMAIDRRNNIVVAKKYNHLFFLSYPDFIPLKQFVLPSQLDSKGRAVTLPEGTPSSQSLNGKYLAMPYFSVGSSDERNSDVLIIDIEKTTLLQTIKVSDNEFSSMQRQFSRDSAMLLTTEASYDIYTGKKIRQWIYPETIPNNWHKYFQMFSGSMSDGNLIFGSSYMNDNTKIYALNINTGIFNVLKDFEAPNLKLVAGIVNSDGTYLAGVVSKQKLEKNQWVVIEDKLIIWKITGNSLDQIYEEVVGKIAGRNVPDIIWSGQKNNCLFKVTIDERNNYKLWRYDIQSDNKIKPINIPIEGLFGGQNKISINTLFVSTYGPRLWDIETGKKIWPWYEALDPFDKSNQLPLYDANPMPVRIRDFWGDSGN